MALKENDVSFFQPLWIRVSILIFLCVWVGWELLYTGDQWWAGIVGLVLVYFVWSFFIKFPKTETTSQANTAPRNDEEPR